MLPQNWTVNVLIVCGSRATPCIPFWSSLPWFVYTCVNFPVSVSFSTAASSRSSTPVRVVSVITGSGTTAVELPYYLPLFADCQRSLENSTILTNLVSALAPSNLSARFSNLTSTYYLPYGNIYIATDFKSWLPLFTSAFISSNCVR